MSLRPSQLRQRIMVALTILSVASSLFVGIALWSSDTFIEDAAVRDLMERALTLQASPEGGESSGPPHHTLRYFDETNVPAALKQYGPGYHGEVELGDDEYNLLVRDIGQGRRGYLAYDVSFVESREQALVLSATALMLLVVGASVWLARRAATRVMRPLNELVAQVRVLDPESRGEHLLLDEEDSDLQVFVEAINQYMARLDALVERERAFAAAASHELRTPLAVIQGAAETLALSADSPALARMRRAVHESSQQLEALLALSRVHESPPKEQLELGRFLHEVADSITGEARAAQLDWDAPQPVPLAAAPGAVAVIFGNLLRNALRAAGDGRVAIHVRAEGIELHDSGPGIPPAELAHVFEPRFRGRDGGTGMGLYIANVLAQRFGWHLRLENRPEGGVAACWCLRSEAVA